MSYLYPREYVQPQPQQRRQSPSLDSILSTNIPSSLDLDQNSEWVIFSPQMSETSGSLIQDESLELPSHSGEGTFPLVVPESPTRQPLAPLGAGHPSAADQPNALERVSQWSSEQSRLVFDELHRLEQRFAWLNTQPEEPEPQQPSNWKALASTVHKLFGLDDHVLELIMGYEPLETPRASPRGSPKGSPRLSAFDRSHKYNPCWDREVVDKVLADMGVQPAPTLSLLQYILGWGRSETRAATPEQAYEYAPDLARDYWEDECSSISTEILAA